MSQLFVRNLTSIDFAYLHSERGLLGESWRVHVELGGVLDDQGMVLDFAEVKRGVKRTLDEHFDHRLLVPARHPGLATEETGDELSLSFPLPGGRVIRHSSPLQAVTMIDADEITPSSVTREAHDVLQSILPANVTNLKLLLEPETIEGAYFHYTHGLKHHGGNCQRIAHGHRSRIEIFRDGERDESIEAAWAERWKDIYIATREDVVNESEDYVNLAYRSAQGEFSLELPCDRCYLVDTDSTIENLAQHVADRTAAEQRGARIQARVFEGIDKGALGESG